MKAFIQSNVEYGDYTTPVGALRTAYSIWCKDHDEKEVLLPVLLNAVVAEAEAAGEPVEILYIATVPGRKPRADVIKGLRINTLQLDDSLDFIPLRQAAALVDLVQGGLGRNVKSAWHSLRYLWLNRVKLGCEAAFRKPAGQTLVNLNVLEKWRAEGAV